jgi:hypothetical protein
MKKKTLTSSEIGRERFTLDLLPRSQERGIKWNQTIDPKNCKSKGKKTLNKCVRIVQKM